jgi:hypothetical protein
METGNVKGTTPKRRQESESGAKAARRQAQTWQQIGIEGLARKQQAAGVAAGFAAVRRFQLDIILRDIIPFAKDNCAPLWRLPPDGVRI